MQEQQHSNLYLVVFPVRDALKIGKANDVAGRLDILRHHWGDPDTSSSWVFQAPEQTVFKLEKALHLMLHEHATPFDNGEGRTEMFSLSALPLALKYLQMWSGDHQGTGAIVQGVAIPEPDIHQQLGKLHPTKRVARRVETLGRLLTVSLDDCTRRLSRVSRIISRLARHQESVPFQWEQEKDGTVIFRLITTKGTGRSLAVKATDLLRLRIQDSTGMLGVIQCSSAGMGDVVQFSVRPPSFHGNPQERFLDYLFGEIMAWLGKLPKKSPAAADGIPAINFGDMLGV